MLSATKKKLHYSYMENKFHQTPGLLACLFLVLPWGMLLAQSTQFDSIYRQLNAVYSAEHASGKLEMLDFFQKNIHIHRTDNYYWVDSLHRRVEFDELSYTNFSSAVIAFNSLKATRGSLYPVVTKINDKMGLSTTVINESIEHTSRFADLSTPRSKQIALEYLLPYRVTQEPVYTWRKPYYDKFKTFVDPSNDTRKTIRNIVDNINLWYISTYNIERRTDPLPFLGSLQLLLRKKGTCEDAANLLAFALRSVGIPCAVDIVPFWGTSTGGHVLNTAFDPSGNPIHVDVLINSDSLYELLREPSKVLRLTYSINDQTLAAGFDAVQIPKYDFLRSTNYLDVTDEYWNVADLIFPLPDSITDTVIYAMVFNGGQWRPAWYGRRVGHQVCFTKMTEGVVYTPAVYRNGKLIPAGNPLAFSKGQTIKFEPSYEHRTIQLRELPGYLKFKPDNTYTLFYFNRKWIKLKSKTIGEGVKELVFERVPKNALLLLKPVGGNGKERPFTIDEQGLRAWW